MALASSSRSEDPMGCLMDTTYHGMVYERGRAVALTGSPKVSDYLGDSQFGEMGSADLQGEREYGSGEAVLYVAVTPTFGIGPVRSKRN